MRSFFRLIKSIYYWFFPKQQEPKFVETYKYVLAKDDFEPFEMASIVENNACHLIENEPHPVGITTCSVKKGDHFWISMGKHFKGA